MKNHVLLNFGILFFFSGVGSALCTAIHHAFGEPNVIVGTNIPLIIAAPVGLVFFLFAVKFAIQPLYKTYCTKIYTMRQNRILSAENEQYLLKQASIFKNSCTFWIFATSWLVLPLVCYVIAYVFFALWVANIQTTPK